MLTQLGHLFEETPAQLRSACERAAAAEAAAAPARAATPPAENNATSTANDPAAADLPADPVAAAVDAVGLDRADNGHSGAMPEGVAAAGPRPASELNVVREGSMELDYGTDGGECCQMHGGAWTWKPQHLVIVGCTSSFASSCNLKLCQGMQGMFDQPQVSMTCCGRLKHVASTPLLPP